MKQFKYYINDRGLTLIEVLVASVLLIVALAPMLGMFTTGAKAYSRGREDTVALNLARDRLEKCLAAGYDNLTEIPDWQVSPVNADYEYKVVVLDYDSLKEIKEVIVTVRPIKNPTGQVKLATLVANWP
ncbi:MAG: hypothetical protein PWP31_71 [Clostridia bacterium]|nr:hypothetical protein [Clostridia bacterium]